MSCLNTNEDLVQVADRIATAVKEFKGDRTNQIELIRQVDRLRNMLDEPIDVIMRQWETSHVIAALHLLVEMGVLEKMPTNGSITAKDLAALIGIDESAIGTILQSTPMHSPSRLTVVIVCIARALRLTVMQGIGEETDPNTFAHNDKSRMFLRSGAVDFFRINVEQMQAFIKLPEYFKTHTHDDLFDLKKSPFAYSLGLEGLSYYEAISYDPDRFNMFNMTMTQMEKDVPVLGMFPFASMKEQVESNKDRPFIVDIGGGRGHVLVAIQEEAPAGFGGRLILQDRPDVIDSLLPDDIPNIEKMPYDFFTPQPIKDAHIYLLRRILHDFYEPVCVQILKNIASAMGPTSRLLIGEMIMPDRTQTGGDMLIYWMDFSMMMLNGKEKSEKEFEQVLDAAGLEIVKIWRFHVGTQAQIECRLKTI
ncbi:O-methyltransferas-like protein [Coleophoma cylindrospora]|uniref:O-methyltransferas-like protein n=1 Tax=Coleophoma cylindrospora TaxID=1849047 RepID=A0A3D8QFJ3_9HELO|nr:O-methyltransferas-like protein [Coleophoma cylindrospora]